MDYSSQDAESEGREVAVDDCVDWLVIITSVCILVYTCIQFDKLGIGPNVDYSPKVPSKPYFTVPWSSSSRAQLLLSV